MNKLNIKEANEHLKQLHRKVFELENQVHMHTLHTQELERINAELRAKLDATEQRTERELAAKDAQNRDIQERLRECESRVDALLQAAEDRDKLVIQLERKAQLFYEVVEHRGALSRIVEVLDDIHKQNTSEVGVKGTGSAQPNGDMEGGKDGRTGSSGASQSTRTSSNTENHDTL